MLISRIEFCVALQKIAITIKLHSHWCEYEQCVNVLCTLQVRCGHSLQIMPQA